MSVSTGQLSAPLLNISNDAGRTNDVSVAHPSNAPDIFLTPSGIVTSLRLLHSVNTLASIISTVAGISNEVIGVCENAPLLMAFISPLIVISSSCEQRNRF